MTLHGIQSTARRARDLVMVQQDVLSAAADRPQLERAQRRNNPALEDVGRLARLLITNPTAANARQLLGTLRLANQLHDSV